MRGLNDLYREMWAFGETSTLEKYNNSALPNQLRHLLHKKSVGAAVDFGGKDFHDGGCTDSAYCLQKLL